MADACADACRRAGVMEMEEVEKAVERAEGVMSVEAAGEVMVMGWEGMVLPGASAVVVTEVGMGGKVVEETAARATEVEAKEVVGRAAVVKVVAKVEEVKAAGRVEVAMEEGMVEVAKVVETVEVWRAVGLVEEATVWVRGLEARAVRMGPSSSPARGR